MSLILLFAGAGVTVEDDFISNPDVLLWIREDDNWLLTEDDNNWLWVEDDENWLLVESD